jgi:hypothetical protein
VNDVDVEALVWPFVGGWPAARDMAAHSAMFQWGVRNLIGVLKHLNREMSQLGVDPELRGQIIVNTMRSAMTEALNNARTDEQRKQQMLHALKTQTLRIPADLL